jgi:ADP-heptose:LPS heptosyltransferase
MRVHRLGDPLPRRVAVLRALQLGDLLCAVPAFRALRAALPWAEIVLIGLPWARSFVARYDKYLDGFREFPGYPSLPERTIQNALVPAFIDQIQGERFDLVIQMHGSGVITNPLAVLLGARLTAGFVQPGQYCPDPDRFLPYPERGLEIRRLLSLLEFLGIDSQGEHPDFPLREEDERALRAIPEARPLRPGSYVCVHVGASTPARRWPLDKFAEVAETLATRGFQVVLTGTADEAHLTAAAARAIRAPVVDLAGRTDLGALAALLSQTRLLVCNDTGVSHLAAAFRVPSVVISTGKNPERWAPLDQERHRVLCRPAGVSPGEVIRQSVDLLRRNPAWVDRASIGPAPSRPLDTTACRLVPSRETVYP